MVETCLWLTTTGSITADSPGTVSIEADRGGTSNFASLPYNSRDGSMELPTRERLLNLSHPDHTYG
jgi:hypothetical protein